MKYFALLTFLTVVLLSGCQSTGVIPMGQDSYFIGKKDGSPGMGVSLSNKASVYEEANAFCNKKGLEVKTLQEKTVGSWPGHLGSTELQFKCVAPGTTDPLVKGPDTVIQIKQ